MADITAHPEQDQEHEGASPSEQLIEAARRNNTDLLLEVISAHPDPEALAALLNNTKSVLGNHVYHEAALRGNYEVIDTLLDQEGFECDPLSVREGDTPLHSAVRYINTLPPQPSTPSEPSYGAQLLSMMIEAGGDPRMKNKANLTPYQLTDPRNTEIRDLLQNAVDVMLMKGDFVEEEEENGVGGDSASDSGSDDEDAPPPPPKK